MSDPAERARVGAASRTWIEAEHGYQIFAPRYLSIFETARLRWLAAD
jgi:hypothetical protein